MAFAKRNPADAQHAASVVLLMTDDEAETLRSILSRIGGCPRNSRRADADAMKTALRRAGVIRPGVDVETRHGFIHFKPNPN